MPYGWPQEKLLTSADVQNKFDISRKKINDVLNVHELTPGTFKDETLNDKGRSENPDHVADRIR